MITGVLIVFIVLTITIISIRKYRFDFFDVYYLLFDLLIRVTAHLYLITARKRSLRRLYFHMRL